VVQHLTLVYLAILQHVLHALIYLGNNANLANSAINWMEQNAERSVQQEHTGTKQITLVYLAIPQLANLAQVHYGNNANLANLDINSMEQNVGRYASLMRHGLVLTTHVLKYYNVLLAVWTVLVLGRNNVSIVSLALFTK
jgi:hypothetical protein